GLARRVRKARGPRVVGVDIAARRHVFRWWPRWGGVRPPVAARTWMVADGGGGGAPALVDLGGEGRRRLRGGRGGNHARLRWRGLAPARAGHRGHALRRLGPQRDRRLRGRPSRRLLALRWGRVRSRANGALYHCGLLQNLGRRHRRDLHRRRWRYAAR